MWKITWGENEWTENDLTVGHVAAIVVAQGSDEWASCDPFAGPMRLLGILSVLIAATDHRPIPEVVEELSLLPHGALLDAVSVVSPDDVSALT